MEGRTIMTDQPAERTAGRIIIGCASTNADEWDFRPAGGRKQSMKHFLLLYETASDYVERRPQFRAQHLRHAWEASERRELAGALADPPDGAVLMFQGDDASAAQRFAESDPHVTNGLVKRWHVREWATVVGDLAANPVRSGIA